MAFECRRHDELLYRFHKQVSGVTIHCNIHCDVINFCAQLLLDSKYTINSSNPISNEGRSHGLSLKQRIEMRSIQGYVQVIAL